MIVKLRDNDTIAAVATAVGESGIAVVRISGQAALSVADKVFVGKGPLSNVPSHTAHFGKLTDADGSFIDEVIAVVFRRPNSYTSEDTVEFSCHGGRIVTQKVLQRILSAGARMAEPGEFTKRAFLNGKIDLSQAEAIGDLIHSQSDAAYKSSLRQLSGDLSREIRTAREELVNLASLLELELDFSDEDVQFANRKTLEDRLGEAVETVSRLISGYSVGRIYKEGVRVTLAGKPNVGKSSLLNLLLQEDRAIVSDIPGTTRDTISESISLGGILFRLTDTAGLRETGDLIEFEGVKRAERESLEGDILLLAMDYGEKEMVQSDLIYRKLIESCAKKDVRVLKVFNKIDLYKTEAFRQPSDKSSYYVSALTGEGIESLKKGLYEMALAKKSDENSVVVTSSRHFDALKRAKNSLNSAIESLKSRKSGEFVVFDLRCGLDALGEITGEVTTEDILNNIFSKFCIGK